MTSRERVLAAINHKRPDRAPMDLGSLAATGVSVYAYDRLKRLLGLKMTESRVLDIYGMLAWVEDKVIDCLGVDIMPVPSLCPRFGIPIDDWKSWRLPGGDDVLVPRGFAVAPDGEDGLLLMVKERPVGRMPRDGFHFSELANATMGGIDSLEEPPDPDEVEFEPLSDQDLAFRRAIADRLFVKTDKALVVDLVDNIRWDCSIPNWLYAMAADPKRVAELHEKKSLNLLEKVKQLSQAVGTCVQVFAIYQDYGTQRNEMVSPSTFERLVLPNYKRIFDWIHGNTEWKVLFHSCGCVRSLVPLMIDMGVDILNPIQTSASRMDPQGLKDEFGDRLVFWGGGVDTQVTLPTGSPEDVSREAVENVSILGAGGGYVFAPCQDIQADVAPENIRAMYSAARHAPFD